MCSPINVAYVNHLGSPLLQSRSISKHSSKSCRSEKKMIHSRSSTICSVISPSHSNKTVKVPRFPRLIKFKWERNKKESKKEILGKMSIKGKGGIVVKKVLYVDKRVINNHYGAVQQGSAAVKRESTARRTINWIKSFFNSNESPSLAASTEASSARTSEVEEDNFFQKEKKLREKLINMMQMIGLVAFGALIGGVFMAVSMARANALMATIAVLSGIASIAKYSEAIGKEVANIINFIRECWDELMVN